jgi:hypothetical protein
MSRKIILKACIVVLLTTILFFSFRSSGRLQHSAGLKWRTPAITDLTSLDTAIKHLVEHSGADQPITLVWKEFSISDSSRQKNNNQ